MITNIYSIYDTVSQVFFKPFTEINNESATRAFIHSMEDNPNKDDYHLFHIGEYNDSNGDIFPCIPEKIYSGLDKKTNIKEVA